MAMNSIPKPFLAVYIAISGLLNVLGLASIAEGFVTWSGFVVEIIGVYHRYLRDPIFTVIVHFWPVAWPKLPVWVVDLFIIQTSFFISYRLFMVFEKQEYRNIFQATRVLQPVLVYIGGPLIPFFQLIRLYGKANKEIEHGLHPVPQTPS